MLLGSVMQLRRRQLFNCNRRAREIERVRERETCLATHIDGCAHRLPFPTIRTIQRFPFRFAIAFSILASHRLAPYQTSPSLVAAPRRPRRPLQTSSQCAHTLELLALDMQIQAASSWRDHSASPYSFSPPRLLRISGKFRNHRIRCCSCINQKSLYLCGDSCYNSIASVSPPPPKKKRKQNTECNQSNNKTRAKQSEKNKQIENFGFRSFPFRSRCAKWFFQPLNEHLLIYALRETNGYLRT